MLPSSILRSSSTPAQRRRRKLPLGRAPHPGAPKAEGKKFEYKVYKDAPGGHYFNRIDTPLALESRKEIYEFLAGYLHPEHPQQ
jgi:hypothetical protein